LTGTYTELYEKYDLKSSLWSSYDFLTVGYDKQVIVFYPSLNYTPLSSISSSFLSQYPSVPYTNLVTVSAGFPLSITWALTAPDKTVQYFKNTYNFVFTPTVTGIYTLALTGLSGTMGKPGTYKYFYNNNIPQITAISPLVTINSLTSVYTPVPGYSINTPLKGWDYNRGIATSYVGPPYIGARPFWAKAFSDKDLNTNYKGIESWGTPLRLVDDYNIISQPVISDISFNTGTRVEYDRNYVTRMYWEQPIQLQIKDTTIKWCILNFDTTSTSNLAFLLNNDNKELVVSPTLSATDLLLQNDVDNQPVEVFYNALTPFIWSVTATPQLAVTVYGDSTAELKLKAAAPWANLTNQTYPTIAAYPVVGDNLYTIFDSGGYTVPNNLGATVYADRDYTTS
jgi:hypothetical protein